MFTQLFSAASRSEIKDKITIFVCGYEATPASTHKSEIVKALKNNRNHGFLNQISDYLKPKNTISYDYEILPYEQKTHEQIKNLIDKNKKNKIAFFVLYHRTQEVSFNVAKEYVTIIEGFFSCVVLIGTGECVLRKPRRLDFSEAGITFAQEKKIIHASLKAIEGFHYDPGLIHRTINPYLSSIVKEMAVREELNKTYPPPLAQIIIDYIYVGPSCRFL